MSEILGEECLKNEISAVDAYICSLLIFLPANKLDQTIIFNP